MFLSYIKIAIRNLLRHRTYSILNILGLTIGIAAFLYITLYIIDETSYDKYHPFADKTYRIVSVYDAGNGVGERSSSCPFPLGPTIKEEYPNYIDKMARIFNFQLPQFLFKIGDQSFNEKHLYFADSTILDIFHFEFIMGDPKQALNAAGKTIITESTAKKYFGDENPMGKQIHYSHNRHLTISGVVKDHPPQTHFKFNLISSMESVKQSYRSGLPKSWVWNPCWTYIVLKDGVSPNEINKRFPAFKNKYFDDAQRGHVTLSLQPITDIHLKSDLDYELEANSDISYIYILIAIGIFLIIIASINFMNLSTAFATARIKEIGVKKVLGSNRKQLIIQFLGEAVMLSLIALLIALALVELFLPEFNSFTDKSITISSLVRLKYIIPILLFGIFVGLLSGMFPAFYLSSFSPETILKSKFHLGKRSSGRKVLVLLQFSISVCIIIGTLVAYSQLQYLKNADVGFNKDEILILPVANSPLSIKYHDFKDNLLQNPHILNVTASDDILGKAHNTHEFRHENVPDKDWFFYPAMVVRDDFLKTYDIEVVAGRDYSKKNKTDPMTGILINEAMAAHMGWTNDEALGKKFHSLAGREKVIGVIKNFNVQSLHKPVGPFVLNMKENPREVHMFTKYISLKVNTEHIPEILEYVKKEWKEIAPDKPFEYRFLDDELADLYSGEDKLTRLAWIFSLLTLLIAGLGLYGLSSFLTEQRTKEIGIRKALGASESSIVKLITKEFFILVSAASIIAWVVANIGLNFWLQDFANSIQINYSLKINETQNLLLPNLYMFKMLLLSSSIALAIAFGITGIKAYITAKMNPVETLRYE